jgi:hypothetical protein
MEFKKIITAILLELEKHKIPYTLIGAVAMGFWGVRRDTVDVDILVKERDREKVLNLMESFGYDHIVSSNFADQFAHVVTDMGLVDFLYTRKEKGIIESSRIFRVGDIDIQVAIPEDIIGMKLDGINNNPDRELQDLADIKVIVELLGKDIDWEKIKEYCKITGMEDMYEKILGFKRRTYRF